MSRGTIYIYIFIFKYTSWITVYIFIHASSQTIFWPEHLCVVVQMPPDAVVATWFLSLYDADAAMAVPSRPGKEGYQRPMQALIGAGCWRFFAAVMVSFEEKTGAMDSYDAIVVSTCLSNMKLRIEFPNQMIVAWISIDQSFSGYIIYTHQFQAVWNILSWNT